MTAPVELGKAMTGLILFVALAVLTPYVAVVWFLCGDVPLTIIVVLVTFALIGAICSKALPHSEKG